MPSKRALAGGAAGPGLPAASGVRVQGEGFDAGFASASDALTTGGLPTPTAASRAVAANAAPTGGRAISSTTGFKTAGAGRGTKPPGQVRAPNPHRIVAGLGCAGSRARLMGAVYTTSVLLWAVTGRGLLDWSVGVLVLMMVVVPLCALGMSRRERPAPPDSRPGVLISRPGAASLGEGLLFLVLAAAPLLLLSLFVAPFPPRLEHAPGTAPAGLRGGGPQQQGAGTAPCGQAARTGLIDVVYTWVNVTDPAWQASVKKNGCPLEGYLGGGGDYDPFDSLRYSIRSLHKHHGTFIRKIIVITARGLRPAWLDPEAHAMTPPLEVRYHDEFMDPGLLPVFNSYPIEASLGQLHSRGITQGCFLYVNDDFVLNRPMDLGDYVDRRGRINFSLFVKSKVPSPVRGGARSVDVPYGLSTDVSRVTDAHIPVVVDAAGWEEANQQWNAAAKSQRCHRAGDVPVLPYQRWLVKHSATAVNYLPPAQVWLSRLPLGNLPAWLTGVLLRVMRPKWLFIESHSDVESRPEHVRMIRAYLAANFPAPSPWESG